MTTSTSNRWFCITPSRVAFFLLVVEVLLWLSERFQWFPFNRHRGYTILFVVECVGPGVIVIFLWLLVALIIRRRFQFSVRYLMLLVLVVTVPCSWLAMDRASARKRWEIIEQFKSDGGAMVYDFEPPRGVATGEPIKPPGPWWLRKLLGGYVFINVTEIDLKRSGVSGVELRGLEELPQLERLTLGEIRLDDADLERLGRLTQLRVLVLAGARVSNAGLQRLEGLTQLRTLNLDQTNVNDEGLQKIKGFGPPPFLVPRVMRVWVGSELWGFGCAASG
jgi:hypothetical protein